MRNAREFPARGLERNGPAAGPTAAGISATAHRIVSGLVFTAAFAVYLFTVAPTVSFWDNGEFLTVSKIVGIPHPPGSPLLTLCGRVMSLLPFPDLRAGGSGSAAFRINLFAVFAAAFAALLVYLITLRLLFRITPPSGTIGRDWPCFLGAATAALVAAFSDQFWENAVEFETYMPSLLLSLLALRLVMEWEERSGDPRAVRFLFLAALLIGLGAGIHLTVLLVLPAVLVIVFTARSGIVRDNRFRAAALLGLLALGIVRMAAGRGVFLGVMAILVLAGPAIGFAIHRRRGSPFARGIAAAIVCVSLSFVGYTVYPVIAVRAAKSPAVNEGNPDTWKRFNAYLDREQYGQGTTADMLRGMPARAADAGYQFGFMYLRYLLRQFPVWGPTAEVEFTNDRSAESPGENAAVRDRVRVSLAVWALFIAGFVLHALRDRRRFAALLLYFLVTSAGLVLYLNMQNPQVRDRDYFFLGSYVAAAIWFGIGLSAAVRFARDLAGEKARRFAPALAAAAGLLGASAIPAAVLSDPVEAGISNWRLHDRSGNFIAWDSAVNLLETCAPGAVLFTNGDNDTYPLWYAREVEGVRRDVRVVNLSLLNAPWYIRDLRDRERCLPASFTDGSIDSLTAGGPESLSLLLVDPEPRETTAGGVTWLMPPSAVRTLPDGRKIGLLSTAAVAVRGIVDAAGEGTPVYFAVTVNPDFMIGLFEHMSIEGLAFRLVKDRAPDNEYLIDAPALERNLTGRYRWRGIADPAVYKTPDTRRILRNYFVAFARLAEKHLKDGRTEEAIRAARSGIRTCAPDPDVRVLLYGILAAHGLHDELGRMVDDEIRLIPPGDSARLIETALRYISYSLPDAALRVTGPLLQRRGNDPDVRRVHIAALYTAGRLDESAAAVESLLALVPGDSDALRLREVIREKQAAGSAPDSSAKEHAR